MNRRVQAIAVAALMLGVAGGALAAEANKPILDSAQRQQPGAVRLWERLVNIDSGTGPVQMLSTIYPSTQVSTTQNQNGGPGPTLSWTYDSNGCPATMTGNGSAVITSVGYNVAGELTQMSGAYNETRGYNALFQMTSLEEWRHEQSVKRTEEKRPDLL